MYQENFVLNIGLLRGDCKGVLKKSICLLQLINKCNGLILAVILIRRLLYASPQSKCFILI